MVGDADASEDGVAHGLSGAEFGQLYLHYRQGQYEDWQCRDWAYEQRRQAWVAACESDPDRFAGVHDQIDAIVTREMLEYAHADYLNDALRKRKTNAADRGAVTILRSDYDAMALSAWKRALLWAGYAPEDAATFVAIESRASRGAGRRKAIRDVPEFLKWFAGKVPKRGR